MDQLEGEIKSEVAWFRLPPLKSKALLARARGDIDLATSQLRDECVLLGFLFPALQSYDGEGYREQLQALHEDVTTLLQSFCKVHKVGPEMEQVYYHQIVEKVFFLLSERPLVEGRVEAFLRQKYLDRNFKIGQRTSGDIVEVFQDIFESLYHRQQAVGDVTIAKDVNQPIRDPDREEKILKKIQADLEQIREVTPDLIGAVLQIIRLVIDQSSLLQELARANEDFRLRFLASWNRG